MNKTNQTQACVQTMKANTSTAKRELLNLKNHIFCGTRGKPMLGHYLNKRYYYYFERKIKPLLTHL